MLDPNLDNPFIYNIGDYNCKPYEDIVYCMGSINLFNYYPRPNLTVDREGSVIQNSNKYLFLDYNAYGYYDVNLNIDEGVIATIIIKPL